MVSIRKKRQQNRRFVSQPDNFDRDVTIGDSANSGQQNVLVNECSVDRDFTVDDSGSIPATIENTVNVRTLEWCFNEKIDREWVKIVDTVEVRIQNAISTVIDNFITRRTELAVTSINASSGQDAACVTVNSERRERTGITASFENMSERNNTFHEVNANDETMGNIPDEVSELSVSRSHFDRQSRTHHDIDKMMI